MNEEWRLIDSGPGGASRNMALDEAIALQVRKDKSPPTLRFYGWDRPALTLGCFQKVQEVDADYCRAKGICIVRRPTGGRAILHGDELTYSFSAKTDRPPFSRGLLDSYGLISAAFHLAFQRIGICAESKRRREKGRVLAGSPLCFRSSSFGEILVENRKVVGAAQKRWEDGLLQQGSIPYSFDEEEMRLVFGLEGSAGLRAAMVCLKEVMPSLDDAGFRDMIGKCFEETFGVSLVPALATPEEEALALHLEQVKYALESWNFQR